MEVIARNVLLYAADAGVSLPDLAAAAGMVPGDIDDLLKGDRVLAAEEYVLLCKHLGVPPSTFVDGDVTLDSAHW